jgi:fatty-acid desaturase
MFIFGGFGMAGAAHRYFTHRSFKATYGMKLFLIFCNQLSGMVRIMW